jgi:hypothetical protein
LVALAAGVDVRPQARQFLDPGRQRQLEALHGFEARLDGVRRLGERGDLGVAAD